MMVSAMKQASQDYPKTGYWTAMDITITQEYTTLAIIDYLYYSKWAPGKYNDLK